MSIDSFRPAALALLYEGLLGLERLRDGDDFVASRGASVLLTFQLVENYQRPTWPAGSVAKQLHLELAVDDLDVAEAAALALGATKPPSQPAPDRWRVLLDPHGHPFCVTTLLNAS